MGPVKYKVSWIVFIFLFLFAFLLDGIQLLLTLIPIPGMVMLGSGVAGFGLIVLGFVFRILLGVPFISGSQALLKVATILGISVAEITPFIGSFWTLTVGVTVTFYLSRKEDEHRAKEEAATREAQAAQAAAVQEQAARLAA